MLQEAYAIIEGGNKDNLTSEQTEIIKELITYARALGVDIDSMLISQPDTGEQGLEICEALVRSGAIDVVVVDSVAALTPRAEIEGDMGDSHVGLLARLMSQALRKLAGSIAKTNCIVIFINQLREIGRASCRERVCQYV